MKELINNNIVSAFVCILLIVAISGCSKEGKIKRRLDGEWHIESWWYRQEGVSGTENYASETYYGSNTMGKRLDTIKGEDVVFELISPIITFDKKGNGSVTMQGDTLAIFKDGTTFTYEWPESKSYILFTISDKLYAWSFSNTNNAKSYLDLESLDKSNDILTEISMGLTRKE